MKKTFFKSLIILTLCFLLMACAVACTEDTDNLTDENLTNEDIPNSEDNSQSTENQHTHFYVSSVIEATCDFDGYTKYTCACGHEYNDNFVNRLNHSFTSYQQNNDATCFSNATETAICDRKGCQQTNTRSIPNSTISHNFVNYIYDGNATCSRDGTKTAQCINDGCIVKDTVSALGTQLKHSFVDYISNNNATCMTNCTETARCSNSGCLVEDTRQIPNSTVDHKFENYVSNNDVTIEREGTKTATCENSGCKATDTIFDTGTNKLLAISYAETISEGFYNERYDYVTPYYLLEYLEMTVGFSLESAHYAVQEANIDWKKHVRRHIELQLSYEPDVSMPCWISPSDILDILQEEWIDAAYYDDEFIDIDWISQGKYFVESLSDYYIDGQILIFNRSDAFSILFEQVYLDGFTYDELMLMINNSDVNWNTHAIQMVDYLWEVCNNQDDLNDKTRKEKIDYIIEELIQAYQFTEEEAEFSIANSSIPECLHQYQITLDAVAATCETTGLTEGKQCMDCEKILVQQQTISFQCIDAEEDNRCDICGSNMDLQYSYMSESDSYEVLSIISKTNTSIVIPNYYNGKKVARIGTEAFKDCTSLISVTIPNNIKSFGDDAFWACINLTNLYYKGTIDQWVEINFGSNPPLFYAENFYINSELVTDVNISLATSINAYSLYYCNTLSSITIGKNVENIGEYAFLKCMSLTQINVDDANLNYKSIDGNLYSKDGKMLIQYAIGKKDENFIIPNGVEGIGDKAFAYSSNLTDIIFNDDVTNIGSNAFEQCNKLLNVQIPDSVTSIGSNAFLWCTGLSNATIGSGVVYIGGLFQSCTNLEFVIISTSLKTVDVNSFYNCGNLNTIYYCGSSSEWDSLNIETWHNENLINATCFYYSEIEPQHEGNYWHYVNGVPTIWE